MRSRSGGGSLFLTRFGLAEARTMTSGFLTVVFLRNNLYVIEDLGSRNHTYVNDRQLNGKAYLKAGDLIRIGFLTLKFER